MPEDETTTEHMRKRLFVCGSGCLTGAETTGRLGCAVTAVPTLCAGEHAVAFNAKISTPMVLSTWTTPSSTILGFPTFILPHASVGSWAAEFNTAVRVLMNPDTHVGSAAAASDDDSCDGEDREAAGERDAAGALTDFRDMMASCVESMTAASARADDGRVAALASVEYLAMGLAATFVSPGFMAFVRERASRGSKVRLFASKHESMLEILADQCEGELLLGVCGLLLKRLNLVGLFSGLYGAENGRPLPPNFTCPKLLHWGLAMGVILRRYYERVDTHEHGADKLLEQRELAAAIAAVGSRSSAQSAVPLPAAQTSTG